MLWERTVGKDVGDVDKFTKREVLKTFFDGLLASIGLKDVFLFTRKREAGYRISGIIYSDFGALKSF